MIGGILLILSSKSGFIFYNIRQGDVYMIVLDQDQVCPYGSFCEYSNDDEGKCKGLDPNRGTVFICELWAENYEKEKEERT